MARKRRKQRMLTREQRLEEAALRDAISFKTKRPIPRGRDALRSPRAR